MRRWVSEQDAIAGWLADQEARVADEREDPECAHCEVPIDEVDCIESGDFLVCSTRCAVALGSYGHTERCMAVECADGAVLTLPTMLCAFCDQPTGGATAHPSCRDRAKRALAEQDAAYGRMAS